MSFDFFTKKGREQIANVKKNGDHQDTMRTLREKERGIDREIRQIEFEIHKVEWNIKEAAKRKDWNSCKILAEEVLKAKAKIEQLKDGKMHFRSLRTNLLPTKAMEKSINTLKDVKDIIQNTNESPYTLRSKQEILDFRHRYHIEEYAIDIPDNTFGCYDEPITAEEIDEMLSGIDLSYANIDGVYKYNKATDKTPPNSSTLGSEKNQSIDLHKTFENGEGRKHKNDLKEREHPQSRDKEKSKPIPVDSEPI